MWQVIDTFKVAADVGPESVSAYVISMATHASDVLAVELLKREACLVVRIDGCSRCFSNAMHASIRVSCTPEGVLACGGRTAGC